MGLLKENISFVVVCYKSSLALKSLLLSIPKESEVILVDNSKMLGISSNNLEILFFSKLRLNAIKSIDKNFLKSQINFNLYKIFKNYIKS